MIDVSKLTQSEIQQWGVIFKASLLKGREEWKLGQTVLHPSENRKR
jgi:hypothetical protein